MKLLVLSLLLTGLTLTQTTPLKKKIEKRNAGESSKLELTSKLENPRAPTSKIHDYKDELPKVVSTKKDPIELESSQIESLKINIEKSKEDQKRDLQIEDASDQTQVDREKKSCKTLTSQPSAPAKFCLEISGSPSTVTICDDDKPSYSNVPSFDHGSGPISPQQKPQSHDIPQPPLYNLPLPQPGFDKQTSFDFNHQQPQIPLNIAFDNVPQQPLPSYINVQPQSNQGILPSVYPVSPQSSFGISTNSQGHFSHLYPYLHHQQFPQNGAGSGQGANIYLVPGSQSYPATYPTGGLQPSIPNYSINTHPCTSGGGIGVYPGNRPGGYSGGYSGGYHGGYPGGSYPSHQLGPQGYYTSCTCKQTFSPARSSPASVIIQPRLASSYGNQILSSNNQNAQELAQPSFRSGGLGTSADLGGFRAAANLGDNGLSTNLRTSGLDSSNSLNIGLAQEPANQSRRFYRKDNDPDQAMDVWGLVIDQDERPSRGPDESKKEDRPSESQKHLQSQTSQMTSQVANSISPPQKSSQQVHHIPEKNHIDDDIVRNFQNQSPAMQQLIMDRARQHLHHDNNPAVNRRYEEMDRISN